MKEEFGKHHKVVAFRIGALGRFSGMEVVDLLGVVDKNIARILAKSPNYSSGGDCGDTHQELRQYIISKEPDMVLYVTGSNGQPQSTKNFYDWEFDFQKTYPLGLDQFWHLYIRQ